MKKFLLCIALCAGCGTPVDGLVGAYTVLGLENVLTLDGKTTTTSVPFPEGTKLVITHDATTPTNAALSLGGSQIATAFLANDGWKTVPRTDFTSDAECRYQADWAAGTLTIDGPIVTLKRSGTVTAMCSLPPSHFGSGTQTGQFSKDR